MRGEGYQNVLTRLMTEGRRLSIAYEHGVELDFSRPGTPTDNAKVESFNGRF